MSPFNPFAKQTFKNTQNIDFHIYAKNSVCVYTTTYAWRNYSGNSYSTSGDGVTTPGCVTTPRRKSGLHSKNTGVTTPA